MEKNEETEIRLCRKDMDDATLCQCVDVLVALVDDDVLVFDALTNIIQVSAHWSMKIFSERYKKWKEDSRDYKRLSSVQMDSIDKALRACFCKADSMDGWPKLRGMFAERIVERAFFNWYEKNVCGLMWQCETGCAVYVNGKIIKYTCNESKMQQEWCRQIFQKCLPNGNCKGDRETVDIGTITLIGGNREICACFVETKLMPQGFHFLDVGYLSYLRQCMDDEHIRCKMVVASLSECAMVRNRIDKCMVDGDCIEVWGVDEIRKWFYA
ncbi:hypothetical protein FZ041_04450 [Selenomonas caprae]|uniref:Uncharacterized protein n=1 Tax=Selenomonas caprae TaxID=2606905 RepID=A0A5D6WMN6_9FIRM|nr:hypothetical protein [Selenomonas caprae]TYZ29841.1 hypothetical protein FZ041_04450 [Selenomonas caprae]